MMIYIMLNAHLDNWKELKLIKYRTLLLAVLISRKTTRISVIFILITSSSRWKRKKMRKQRPWASRVWGPWTQKPKLPKMWHCRRSITRFVSVGTITSSESLRIIGTISRMCLNCSSCFHKDIMRIGAKNSGATTTKKLLNCKID